LTTGEGPGYCDCDCTLLRIEFGKTWLRTSTSELTCESEVTLESVGVNEVGGVSGICDEEISRAGLGNVLYVDPREVYLHIEEISVFVLMIVCRTRALTPDHIMSNKEH
jgi:hypothetical protein